MQCSVVNNYSTGNIFLGVCNPWGYYLKNALSVRCNDTGKGGGNSDRPLLVHFLIQCQFLHGFPRFLTELFTFTLLYLNRYSLSFRKGKGISAIWTEIQLFCNTRKSTRYYFLNENSYPRGGLKSITLKFIYLKKSNLTIVKKKKINNKIKFLRTKWIVD